MEIWENRNIKDLDGEIWKIIENYPDYAVSNYGRIKRIIPDRGINEKIKNLQI